MEVVGFASAWQEFWGGEESIWDRRISPQQKHKDFYDFRCATGNFIGGVEIIMQGFIRRFLMGPFISILLLAGFFPSHPAIAAANEENLEVWKKEAGRLIRKGDCGQAWQVIWKEARKGNSEAVAGLLEAIYVASLIPPSYFPFSRGAPQDLVDNMVTLRMYARKNKAAAEDLRRFGMMTDDLMGEYVEPDVRDKIQSVNRCLKGKHNVDVCFEKAVKLRLIPSFEQYVVLMDNAPRPAFCLPDRRPPRNSAEELGLSPIASEPKSVPLTHKEK
ncbi:hypothetical protein [Rhizobium fabae]|uniref:Uncharacterized protein n=1 Tax=Rhizobium fabae TaxID=573179 RepID=A0A7W6BBD4_9HYPH|nr:hypothetical protein [Rhizobium fabae]MBB3919208.1 hypothetical protein [Rhizobium fabae]RUM16499.1 hypothetical protein EFB14_00155 [Rhizobium fabae]